VNDGRNLTTTVDTEDAEGSIYSKSRGSSSVSSVSSVVKSILQVVPDEAQAIFGELGAAGVILRADIEVRRAS
jgi:hypothetical protein